MKNNLAKFLKVIVVFVVAGLFVTFLLKIYQNDFNKKNRPKIISKVLELDEVKIGIVAGLENSLEKNFYPNTDPNMPEGSVTSQFLQTLVYFDNNYKIQPLLAESWQTLNPTTWRFNLRQNVKFSNGDFFTAEDVKYTMDTIKTNAARFKGTGFTWDTVRYTSDIKQVKVIGPYVLEIVTNGPKWSLLSKLAGLYILSRNSFKVEDTQPPVGTGPFILQKVKKGEPVILLKNENYWGEKAKVKKITYRVIASDTERVNALKNKEVDLIEYVPVDQIAELKKDSRFNVTVTPNLNVWFIGFDYQRNKSPYISTLKNPFKDIKVRQAVYHAINIDELIQNTYKGYAEAQSQMVSNYTFGFNPNIKRLDYDLEKAKKLLAEAGYKNGFKVNLDVSHPKTGEYAQEVVRQLKKIGIDATIKVRRKNETSEEDRAKYKAGDTSMYFTATYVDGGNAQATLGMYLHTRTKDQNWGTGNYGFYSNPQVDSLIEKSAYEMDDNKRLSVMQEAMKIAISDDFGFVPVNTDGIGHAFAKNITWIPRPDGRINAYEISGEMVR